MTLSELRSRIRSLTAIQSSAVLPDADIDNFISESQRTICSTATWPFLTTQVSFTAVAGSDTVVVSLPRTAHRVVDAFAKYVDNEKPWQMFERSAPFIAEDADGHTVEYAWDADSSTVSLYPAPNKDIEITARFVLAIPQVSADADLIVPAEFRHGIAYLSAASILEREADDSPRAQAYNVKAIEVTTQMRQVLMTSSRGSFIVGGRRGYRRSARRGAW